MSPHAKTNTQASGKRTFRSFQTGTSALPLVLVEKLSSQGRLNFGNVANSGAKSETIGDPGEIAGREGETTDEEAEQSSAQVSSPSLVTRTGNPEAPDLCLEADALRLAEKATQAEFLRMRGGCGLLDATQALQAEVEKIHRELEERAKKTGFDQAYNAELVSRLGMYMRKYPEFFEES
jgi:hypothetical protein